MGVESEVSAGMQVSMRGAGDLDALYARHHFAELIAPCGTC